MQGYPYTSGMNAPAALGVYLFTLRKGRGLEPRDILPVLTQRLNKKVDHSRLWRAENGDAGRWPETDLLLELIELLGGDVEDLRWFRRNPNAPATEGEERARKRLATPEPLSDEERELIEGFAQLKGKRRQAARLILQDLLSAEAQNGEP